MFSINLSDNNDNINNKMGMNDENFQYLLSVVDKQKKLIEHQHSNTNPESPSHRIFKHFERLLRKRNLWIVMASISLMSLILAIVIISVTMKFADSAPKPSNGHFDDLGHGIQIIHRKEWNGRPPLSSKKITTPPKLVRVLHTGGAFCTNYQTCAGQVLTMQGWQVGSQGMPDIAYNYMIGGDGNVYEARGADIQNEWMPSAIDIGYLGNYLTPYDKLTDKMNEAGIRLIEWLRKCKKIKSDYSVIAHNQTYNTQSPGQNIYKKIVHWPHYDSGLYF